MINELLLNSQRIQQQKPSLKTVRLKFLGSLILKTNDLGDQPIFRKQSFKYDKYELAKIINFDDFQLLFRPYKNDPSFKENIYWNKITKILPIIMIIILVSQFIFLKPNTSITIIAIWAICTFVLFTLSLIILFCYSRAEDKCINGLQDYCIALSSQQNNISIKFVRELNQKKFMKFLFPKQICFDIKSKTIEEDDKVVKLYTEQGFEFFSSSLSKPIFTQNSYQFDENRLYKIMPFKQLQLIFRPFKQNQAYQKTSFWNKILLLLIPSFLLSLTPLILKEPAKDDTYLLVICLSIFFSLYGGFFLIIFRISGLNSQLILEFIEYCQIISRKHQKISVIPHIKQRRPVATTTASCCQITEIYCLQVKCKQV